MKHGREIYTVHALLIYLAGLILAESVGYEGLIFLVLLGRGNLEGALKRERSALAVLLLLFVL